MIDPVGEKLTDEVDASPLLEHLQEHTSKNAVQITRRPKTTLETISPGVACNPHLMVIVGLDLRQLSLDSRVGSGLAADTLERSKGVIHSVLADIVARRFRQQEKTKGKDGSPDKLEANGDTIGRAGSAILAALVDNRSHKKSDGDGPLISGHQETTDTTRADFRDVENDDRGDTANTQSSNETTGDQTTNASSANLDGNTNREDQTSEQDGKTTTKPLGEDTAKKGTDKGTSGKDRSNQRLARGGDSEASRVIIILEDGMTEVLLDVVHAEDTRDVTRVIAVEDSCQRVRGSMLV